MAGGSSISPTVLQPFPSLSHQRLKEPRRLNKHVVGGTPTGDDAARDPELRVSRDDGLRMSLVRLQARTGGCGCFYCYCCPDCAGSLVRGGAARLCRAGIRGL